jgi:hypothetical protein
MLRIRVEILIAAHPPPPPPTLLPHTLPPTPPRLASPIRTA